MNVFTWFCIGKPQGGSPKPSTRPYVAQDAATILEYETEVIKQNMKAKTSKPHFTGRGGRGNMAGPIYGRKYRDSIAQYDSEIISRHFGAKAEIPYSSGRGGFGNVASPQQPDVTDQSQATDLEYEKRIINQHRDAAADKPHRCGRGGMGNVASPIRHSPKDPSRSTSTSSTLGIHEEELPST